MAAYLSMKGIVKEDDVDLFLMCVPDMDDMWLEDYAKRQEEADRVREQKAKRGRR